MKKTVKLQVEYKRISESFDQRVVIVITEHTHTHTQFYSPDTGSI